MLVKKITSYPFHFLTKMKFRPYLFPKYSGFGKEFQQKKEPPQVGIRMGFLIAKHILYSGKTMDQTNEILFIQEKRKEIVNLGFQRYTKRNEM